MPGFDSNPNVTSSAGLRPAVGSQTGVQFTSQSGLPYARWVAKGWGWQVTEATASPVAVVAALPTTTAGLTLHNLEPANGRWYVIHSVYFFAAAGPATLSNCSIGCVVGRNPVADAVNDLARSTSITPLLGGAGNYKGSANADLAAAVIDDLWKPCSDTGANNLASTGGSAIFAKLDGIYIIQPRCQFSIKGLGNSTSVTGQLGITWFEVDPSELM